MSIDVNASTKLEICLCFAILISSLLHSWREFFPFSWQGDLSD